MPPRGWKSLYSLGIDRVIADLYFTLPFDLGIIEASQKFTAQDAPTRGEVENYDKVFVGEPYEVDSEASMEMGLKSGYLNLIREARVGLEG